MEESNIFISKLDNTTREIGWVELNQLKKDILWIYDENIGQLNSCFAPSYSFSLKYWEYLTLDGNKWFAEDDIIFYKTGDLVILLCFCVEYNDISGGHQEVFNRDELPTILKYVNNYLPKDDSEKRIKDKIVLGITIAISMTNDQLLNSEFEHKDLPEFYENINTIGDDFIISYYESKLNQK